VVQSNESLGATAQPASTKVSVGQHEFHLNYAGDPSNPAILFLHGSGPGATGASNWQAVLHDLGDDYFCLAPDVIGFGDSSHPDPRPAGLGQFTQLRIDALFGLLDALDVERAHVVGNSMGGMWTLGMARQVPSRIDRMILMGAGGPPEYFGPSLPQLIGFYDGPTVDTMAALLREFVYSPELFGDDLDEIAAERLPRAVRPEVEASHRATFDLSVPWEFGLDDVRRLTQETLVIHGREDKFVRFAGAVYYFENLPNARLYGLGRCGHWAMIEHHERFVYAVREFLEGRL
jgi:2-hydroxymuconate-semialdehyde hydrolase